MTNAVKYRLLCKIWEDTTISPEEMETLVSNGSVEPNDMILWSVMNGREDLVSALLAKGANPNKRGYNDEVPALFRAAEVYHWGGTFSAINTLIKNGANPHYFMEWYDGAKEYYGTVAVVIFKVFGINILKNA